MRRVGVLASALALMLFAAPAAPAQEDDGTRFPTIGGYDTDPGYNAKLTVSNIRSLNVALEPADLGIYEKLIGAPIKAADAPSDGTDAERPLIDFKLHNIGGSVSSDGTLTGGTYETWIDLRAKWCGRKGWFNNATAVQDSYLYAISRATGYPKIFAESIRLRRSPDGQTATGVVTQAGEELIRLEWRKDDAAVEAALADEPWRARWLQGKGELYRGNSWTYEPIGDVGAFVKQVYTEEVGENRTWNSRVGMVKVTVNQDANRVLTNGNWMALVPETVEVPGMLEHYAGSSQFYGRSLQCGAQGSTTADALPWADTVAP